MMFQTVSLVKGIYTFAFMINVERHKDHSSLVISLQVITEEEKKM